MFRSSEIPPASKIQSRLIILAALCLFLLSVGLSLSPAGRERTWEVDYRWAHWIGYFTWVVFVVMGLSLIRRLLPDADAFLFPASALLTGWGLLTIFRLSTDYGLRQTIWLILGGIILLLCLRLDPSLRFLKRYKYLWLIGGLLLTTLTLLFGTNPTGVGPRLWLGCCGVYFQPSEPLKLLLVIYLAAYFSERLPVRIHRLPPIAPTLVVTGAALLLLLVQRDLGAVSLFIYLYTICLYLVSKRTHILWISLLGIVLVGLAGYFLFDVVRIRIDAWLNPWLDPSGRSYQIVQSLLAVANGGILGRGLGLGNPGLVPIAISDFIFSTVAEETGLMGTLGLLILLGVFIFRGLRTALRAQDNFRRLLAAGLTAYIGTQSILIIGGNLRLLPLTGVTLPFVSYGGSSLLTSFITLAILLIISGGGEDEPAPLLQHKPYTLLGGFLLVGLCAAALINGWWAVVRGPDLLTRTDNARRAIADRYVPRGDILDRDNQPITTTIGQSGSYTRYYRYPDFSSTNGYTHPVYGQAGLEASLDRYLRGLLGNPVSLIWWNHLLYGTPPPGLDVRLSIDTTVQQKADSLLGSHAGAVIMLNAKTGEILAMASHPTYDPNHMDEIGASLPQDPERPLLNRATQGLYPLGAIWSPLASMTREPDTPDTLDKQTINNLLGFSNAPLVRIAVAEPIVNDSEEFISPLQLVLAAAAISNEGIRPAPRLAIAVNTPRQGWVILPALGKSEQIYLTTALEEFYATWQIHERPYWQITQVVSTEDQSLTWSLAGTPSNWSGIPLTVVVLLEEDRDKLAEYISLRMLDSTLQP